MKIAMLMGLLMLAGTVLDAQTPSWEKATDWKLYEAGNGGRQAFVRDSISYYQTVPLNADTMQRYLAYATVLAPEKTQGAAWMGEYWISCEYQDSVKVFRISHYGGFFVDTGSGIYYVIDRGLRHPWEYFFTRMFLKFEDPGRNAASAQ